MVTWNGRTQSWNVRTEEVELPATRGTFCSSLMHPPKPGWMSHKPDQTRGDRPTSKIDRFRSGLKRSVRQLGGSRMRSGPFPSG